MDDNNKNNQGLDFDLDEIIAGVDKTKKEVAAAFDSIFGTEQQEPADAPAADPASPAEEPEKSSELSSEFDMKPEEPVEESSAPVFDMKPEEQAEKAPAPEFDMKAADKEDVSEALSDDFGKIDQSSEIEKASAEFDKAQDEAAGIRTAEAETSANAAAAGVAGTAAAAGQAANAAAATRVVSLRPSETPDPKPADPGLGNIPKSPSYEYSRPAASIQSEPERPAPAVETPKKEKKYVTRGTLIGCMILTMLLSTLLGSMLGGIGRTNNAVVDNRAERNDSELSNLNLSDATGGELTVAQIVDKNEDAVVEIMVSATTRGMWGQMQPVEGAGSGVIVSEDGYIATNYHVIAGANRVQVTLHNGNSYSAQVIGSDPANDIAVVKIEESGLTTAEIGDSSTVDVGDLAVAIGNPLGQLGGTATTGIISALDRTLTVEGTPLTLLQTDAAINGGNSGGGLFNSRGELIGIVESKASAVGVEGLAFALPINSVSGIINDIIENGGDVSGQVAGTPAVGVVISDVSEEVSEYYGLEEPGVYIAQVTGINAQQAGFQEQDRIVSFNGSPIENSSEFITLVRKCKVGDTVTIVVSRQGQEIEIKTVLEELQPTN